MKGRPEKIGDFILEGCRLLQVEIQTDVVGQLEQYVSELLRWSKKINLIGKKQSLQQVIENHFIDSLILTPYLSRPGTCLMDVGTGAGFPGLVCKTVLPDLKVILIEPRLKRVSFLRHIIRSLNLDCVTIFPERIENIDSKKLRYTHITSRAVTEIGPFLRMVEDISTSATKILCMKGPRWRDELEKASPVLEKTGITLSQVDEFILPYNGAERAVLSFQRGNAQ